MEQLTSNPYMIPECAYAVDANTLFERSRKFQKLYIPHMVFIFA
ncbi:MAG: hypothetical protein QXK37_00660 [Candidatus Woesearchaeota archaeon]